MPISRSGLRLGSRLSERWKPSDPHPGPIDRPTRQARRQTDRPRWSSLMAPPHRTVHAAIARDQCSESCISSPERLESAWLSHGRAPWLDPLVQEYGSGTVPMGVCVRTQEYLPVAHQARRVASVLSQVTGITLGSIEPRPISRVLKTSRNAALLPSTSLRVTCPANSPRRSGATAVQCSVRTWVRSPARMVLGGKILGRADRGRSDQQGRHNDS